MQRQSQLRTRHLRDANSVQRLRALCRSRPPYLNTRQTYCRGTLLEDVYLGSVPCPPEYQGSVKVVHLPGRGRGVVASTDLEAGQLVLISKPVAYVTCPMGGIPPPEELADAIRSSALRETDLHTLLSLYAGEDLDDDVGGAPGELDDFRLYGIIARNSFGEEFTDFATTFTRASAAAASPSRGAPGAPSPPNPPPPTQPQPHLESQQQQQGPGGGQDGADSSRDGGGGGPPEGGAGGQKGHLGLFPAFSMLNHSCAPNAVNFVVGGSMVVVAARRIPQGSEVLINYLGRSSLRPVEERQTHLAEGYFFSCDCPRCRAELLAECSGAGGGGAGAGPGGEQFGERVQALLTRCTERNDALIHLQRTVLETSSPDYAASFSTSHPAASTDGPGSPYGAALSEVNADVAVLEELVHRAAANVAATQIPVTHNPDPDTQVSGNQSHPDSIQIQIQQWLRASGFDLYSQYVEVAEVAGRRGEAVAVLRRQVAVAEVVAPHTDLHLYLALKLLSLVQQAAAAAAGGAGGDDAAALAADAVAELQQCVRVVRGRYGSGLSDATVQLLLEGAAWGLSQVVV